MQKCKAQNIIPHRSYRRLKIHKLHFFSELLVYFLFSAVAVYLYAEYLINTFSLYFKNVLLEANIDAATMVVDIFGFPVTLLKLSFVHTQPIYLFFILAGMVILFYILRIQRVIPYNIAMWLNFFILIFIVFLLYFIFLGGQFPYSFIEYFELYTTAHIGLMFFSLVVTASAVALTPAAYWMKGMTLVLLVGYYMFYSLVRYALVVLLTSQLSIVMAPIMFFTLYLDFIFFVSAYGYFLYKSAVLFQKKDEEWSW